MAKRFAGFTPDQLGKIVPEMAGMQSDEQAKFLAANPAAASRVNMMTEKAQAALAAPAGMAMGGYVPQVQQPLAMPINQVPSQTPVPNQNMQGYNAAVAQAKAQYEQQLAALKAQFGMAKGGYVGGYAVGGDVAGGVMGAIAATQDASAASEAAVNPHEKYIEKRVTEGSGEDRRTITKEVINPKWEEWETTKAQEDTAAAMKDASAQASENAANLAYGTLESGGANLVGSYTPVTTTAEQKAAGTLAEGTGQLGAVAGVTQTTAEAQTVEAPTAKEAVTYEPLKAEAPTQEVLDRLVAATGKPSAEALAEAQTMDPEQLSQLGLSAAQLDQAQKVVAPEARTIQEGEMIEGTTVDQARVEKAIDFEAATGAPSSEATVQGQLTGLMEQFEEGKPPPAWAAGAMRAATAAMAARGITASSMAGQAVVQAAMESALPIASQDAQTAAQFEMQNLSNRQQKAMMVAQQRAAFLELEFNQDFQTRVANAAKISDIANMNFTAEQQIALENARMAQSVDLANLSAKNAKVLADAAAMTQVEVTNLSNRQQAAVQNAQAFLEMDMTNLANEQQTSLFKAQAITNAILSDTAAVNAAKQFNATSQMQVDQFYDSLATNVALENASQINAMEKFNAGEANAINTFLAQAQNQRDQFNASNALVIAQANALWSQTITTTDNAALNNAARDTFLKQTDMTMTAYNAAIQLERDTIDYIWRSSESAADRENNLAIAEMKIKAQAEAAKARARGSFFGKILGIGASIVSGNPAYALSSLSS